MAAAASRASQLFHTIVVFARVGVDVGRASAWLATRRWPAAS